MSTTPSVDNLQSMDSKQEFVKLLNEWTNGNKMSITNRELDLLLSYFQKLNDALSFSPEAYRLVRNDCLRHLAQLTDFKESRQNRR